MTTKRRILIVEDNPGDVYLMQVYLQDSVYFTYETDHSSTLKETLEREDLKSFDLIALDLGLPDSAELDALETIRSIHPEAVIVIVSGREDIRLVKRAITLGAQDYLLKGELNTSVLDKTFAFAIERKSLEQAIEEKESAYQKAKRELDMLTENTKDLFVIIDFDRNLKYISPNYSSFFGSSMKDVVFNDDIFLNIYEADRELLEIIVSSFIEGHIKQAQPEFRLLPLGFTDPIWVSCELTIKESTFSDEKVLMAQLSNIHERKLAEIENLKLLKAINQSANSIVITDIDGNISYVNKIFEKVTGYTAEEAIGNNPKVLKSGLHDEQFYQNLWNTISSGKTWSGELINKKKNGEHYWEKATIDPVMDDYGQVISYIAVKEDITDRKHQEEALRENKQRLEMALQGTNAGLWDWNIETGETVFNERWAEIIGYSLEELSPATIDTWMSHCHPDDLLISDKKLHEHWEGKTEFYDCRVRMNHKDGSEIWVWDRGKTVEWNDEGKPVRMLGTHVEITDHVNNELKLKEREHLYRTVIESLREGVIVFDSEGKINLVNTAASKILNVDKADLIGKDSFDPNWNNVDVNNKPLKPEEFPAEVTRSTGKEIDNFIIKSDVGLENRMILSINSRPIFGADQKVDKTVLSFSDITSQFESQQIIMQSEKSYRFLLESFPHILFKANYNGEITYVNENGLVYLGVSFEDIKQLGWLSIIHPEDYDDVLNKWRASVENNSDFVNIQRMKKGNGEYAWFRTEVMLQHNIYDGHHEWVGHCIDITDRINSEEKKIALTMEVEERERRNISQEIHDSLQQTLVSAQLNFQSVKKEIDQLSPTNHKRFETGFGFLEQGLQESRSIAHRLMPKALQDLGLVDVLESHLDKFKMKFEYSFYNNLNGIRLPSQVEFTLYRITQEAISNILKYSEADHVSIQLIKTANHVNYSIEDDGIGFDTTLIGVSDGIGIMSIKNRVGTLGGTCDIDSRPGHGTLIMINFDLVST